MKKTLIFSGLMLAAAFTLTNCVKETVNPAAETKEGVPFEIVAGIGTKTAVSPVAGEAAVVEWKADDAINLFVAETGGEYSTSNKFTIAEADLATGRFVGNLSSALDPQKTYEYKVVYPWTSGLKIDNTAEGGKYIAFGSKSNATQTQVGNNNADHLAGSNMPLYGVVKQVAGSATPQIEMHQAMAVVKVHVTNKSNAPLTVTSVAVTAPEGTLINGTFYMNFSGDEPTYTSSGATYTSNTAGLAVTSGAEIANNESADFYIGVLPFTLASGAKLGVSINGTEKEKAATAETVFAAGKIKTVNVDYEGSSVVYNTVAEVLKAGVGTYNMQNLLVYDANNANAIVGDDTGKMLLYKSNHGFVAGDNITIIGADVSNYNGVLEIKGGTMTKNSSDNPVSHGDPLDLDVEANAQSMPTTDGWYSAVYVKMKGQQDSGRNIQGTYLKLYLNANNNDTKNKNVVVTGYAYSYSTQYLNHSFHAVTIVENSNTLTVSPTSLNWAASETDAKDIAVTLNDGASGFTVSPETDNDWNIVIEDASVKVSPKAANTSTEAAKSITLTFTHKDEPTVQKTVTCSQAKASSGSEVSYTLTFPDDNSSNNGLKSNQYTSTWTATSGTTSWSISNFNNNNWNNNWAYIKCGRKNNASVATIVTDAKMSEAIKTVTLTINNVTADKINSVKLYSSSDGSSWTEEGSFTVATGDKTVSISSPAADRFYKLEFDCASGSSNGLLTLSKVVYSNN